MAAYSAHRPTLRDAALTVGAVTVAFGIALAAAPGRFSHFVGMPVEDGSVTTPLLRLIGISDTVTGLALASAAQRDGNIAPWLLVRTLWEGSASLLIGWTLVRGRRNGALGAVGLLAFGTSLIEALLWRAAKRAGRARDEW